MKFNSVGDYQVFTVCNLAYLHKALVLAESFLTFHKTKIIIYLIDRKINIELCSSVADFVWIEDLEIPDLYTLAFKYDITEFSTSVKPYLTLELLKEYEKVIFLDPDTCVYHSIEPILKDLDEHPIVLTPHYVIPQSDDFEDSDLGMMRFGSFNLGFFGIKNSEEGISFLRWWNNRCFRYSYFETQLGLSTDQKWVSIAPCFFKDLYISFNLGYNMAFWNVHEREVSTTSEGSYLINNKFPLIFFHFSSFDENHPELLSKRPFSEKNKKRKDLLILSLNYKEALSAKKNATTTTKYGFDYMSNGNYISPTLRRAYAAVFNKFPKNHDPFDSNGVVGKFAKKNYLIEKKALPYITAGYENVEQHQWKFKIINFFLKCTLYFIGPNQFANFSRLLVYLSSYRLNKKLWKL